ncbi:urease accessory protein UreD [Mycolicibacterium litorale]|uniref:Urease accessory protein n=1 Tax=Mycolicibacterium litorale TaxID=758802 RepID=A0AAD1MU83_9MYCO|nr:urease accessory protein UreD [Mycolicibacterium litorale]MCV7414766.1 urease accessory protein UreD [Mycolicibacterium litorale]TDY08011.1 urease accessory protein [Mycolicibacterium litorale]BBY15931.1 urease accessory protein [Mycolicibacterium litorale]
MRSEVYIVAYPGRTPRIEHTGGVAVRRTGSHTVHLVSAAATPLGGDVISVRVVVEPGARLAVRSAAATVTLPSAATPESRTHWDVESAGELDIDPQPTVVAGASRHLTETRIRLTGAGSIRLRERIQIGRSGEREGFWSGALHADVDGAPLLRHRVELGGGSVTDDVIGRPLACVSELRYPEATFDTEATVLALAAGGCLATWQGERLTN